VFRTFGFQTLPPLRLRYDATISPSGRAYTLSRWVVMGRSSRRSCHIASCDGWVLRAKVSLTLARGLVNSGYPQPEVSSRNSKRRLVRAPFHNIPQGSTACGPLCRATLLRGRPPVSGAARDCRPRARARSRNATNRSSLRLKFPQRRDRSVRVTVVFEATSGQEQPSGVLGASPTMILVSSIRISPRRVVPFSV